MLIFIFFCTLGRTVILFQLMWIWKDKTVPILKYSDMDGQAVINWISIYDSVRINNLALWRSAAQVYTKYCVVGIWIRYLNMINVPKFLGNLIQNSWQKLIALPEYFETSWGCDVIFALEILNWNENEVNRETRGHFVDEENDSKLGQDPHKVHLHKLQKGFSKQDRIWWTCRNM